MSTLKILVCGDVEGNFKTLFKTTTALQKKKGPFEYLLCVGNFFGLVDDEWKDVVAGKISVPLTTYILGPNKPEHIKYFPEDSGELTSNIIFLGKQGILTGSSGLKIAYLSGLEGDRQTGFSFSKENVLDFVRRLSEEGNSVDILLTSQWPKGVTKYAKENFDMSDVGSNSIAALARHIKPRYHFSGISGFYYERLPYRNNQTLLEKPVNSTRFIGLSSVQNDKNFKWLYAFNIVPFCSASSKELLDASSHITECPYNSEEFKNQFFFDMGSSQGCKRTKSEEKGSYSKKRQTLAVTQDKCWFCLTNPDLEKQLLLSIGEYSYLTLAKGGLVRDHLLIIPTDHLQSSIDLCSSAEIEVKQYKDALVEYFHNCKKDVVFFERNFASPHLQIQVIPIPKSIAPRLKDAILEFAELNQLEFTELSKCSLLKQVVPKKKPYFYFEIMIDKRCEGRLLHIIDKTFPLQFGRMALASKAILNMPDRVDWKKCQLDSDEELENVKNIKKRFKEYDFTNV